MKRFDNRGAALLIVLLTITIIGIFSTVIISVVLSASHQTDKIEASMQARDLAEMGVEAYRTNVSAELRDIIKDVKDAPDNAEDTKAEILTKICSNTISQKKKFNITESADDEEFKFDVRTTGFRNETNESIDCTNYKKLRLNYRSIGTAKTDSADTKEIITGFIALNVGNFSGGGSGGSQDDRVFHSESEFDTIIDPSYPKIPADIPYEKTSQEEIPCETLPNLEVTDDAEFSTCTYDIKGSLLVHDDATLLNKGSLTIEDHATFKDDGEFLNNTVLNIGKNAIFDETAFQNNAEMSIGGHASFGEEADFYQNTKSSIGKNAIFRDSITMHQNSELYVGRNFYTRNELTVKNNALLTIDGSVKLDGEVSTKKGTIIINGNAFFNQPISNKNGRICIKGRAEFTDNQSVRKADSCANQPKGTIYVLDQYVSKPYVPGDGGGEADWSIDFGDNEYTH
ncbi:type II secretion system protein [Bacillus piscicola]|uniref:type II secretion system protein n=1 Tax=Bacillus piscicola TaxID=1632684 RepID=UPI001F08A737|nr:type II secretion system protein [Bacillus piscicola]